MIGPCSTRKSCAKMLPWLILSGREITLGSWVSLLKVMNGHLGVDNFLLSIRRWEICLYVCMFGLQDFVHIFSWYITLLFFKKIVAIDQLLTNNRMAVSVLAYGTVINRGRVRQLQGYAIRAIVIYIRNIEQTLAES